LQFCLWYCLTLSITIRYQPSPKVAEFVT